MILEHQGYIGEARFDEEAQTFYGHVLNSEDTITFQAETRQQLEKEFHASVDAHIALVYDSTS